MEFKYRAVDYRTPPTTSVGFSASGSRVNNKMLLDDLYKDRIKKYEESMHGQSFFHENRYMTCMESHSHDPRLADGDAFNVLSRRPQVKYLSQTIDTKVFKELLSRDVKRASQEGKNLGAKPDQSKVGLKRKADDDKLALPENKMRVHQECSYTCAHYQVSSTSEIISSVIPTETKYEAVSDRLPSLTAYRSASQGIDLFTKQAAPRATNAAPNFYPIQYCTDVGGTIPWDVRREQIKLEIAEESVKLEKLKSEMRIIERDIAIRREMLMSGGSSFHETQLSVFNSRLENHLHEERAALGSSSMVPPELVVPNACGGKIESSPDVNDKKDKLIILPRPILDEAAGSKRKAETPPALDDDKPILPENKKRAYQAWSCAVCQVSATSESTFNEHLQGKKHKSKQATLNSNNLKPSNPMVSCSKTKVEELLPLQQSKTRIISDKIFESNPDIIVKNDGSGLGLCCALCKVSMTSKTGFYEHLQGKKHKSKEAVRKLLQESKCGDGLDQKSINRECTNVGNETGKLATVEKTSGSKNENKHKLWCALCDVGAEC
ncbi:hypothetical protein ACFE04_000338 [Oxalis oulophora]